MKRTMLKLMPTSTEYNSSFQIPLLNPKRSYDPAETMMDPGPLAWSKSAAWVVAWRETRAAAVLAMLAATSIAWFGRSFAVPCLDDPCARTQGGLTSKREFSLKLV